MVDDMGYRDLGCYGSKTIKTPNIDKLATEGTRFTDCYSGDAVCASARSTLMAGTHKGQTPVRGNSGGIPLFPSDVTIVFFTSDNGAAKRFDGVHNSSGELKGFKRSLQEGGIRVPMIARWPGKIASGATSDFPWYFPDVFPTFADLAAKHPEIASRLRGYIKEAYHAPRSQKDDGKYTGKESGGDGKKKSCGHGLRWHDLSATQNYSIENFYFHPVPEGPPMIAGGFMARPSGTFE